MTDDQAAQPRNFRILSLDGGPSAPVYLHFLLQIEKENPGFLAQTDLFAGSSDGAGVATFFASKTREELQDGQKVIRDAIKFDQTFGGFFALGLRSTLRLLTGFRSAYQTQRLEGFLEKSYGGMRLGQLTGRVVLVSFNIRGKASVKVFNNLEPGDPDLEMPASHAVLRSCAFPVMLPTVQGSIDGSVYANSPSVVALATVKSFSHGHKKVPELRHLDCTMLSMGGAAQTIGSPSLQRLLTQDRTNWGWLQWALWPTAPLLVMQLMVNADAHGAAFISESLLGNGFLRMAFDTQGAVQGFMNTLTGHLARSEQNGIEQVTDWVQKTAPSKADQFATERRCAWRRTGYPGHAATMHWIDTRWMS
ncbi:MAG: hypothetical protein GXP62_07515 [Oligoflexia bacterium]|nr:hypothetical protein [Oligoflexia bacterium]